MSQSFFQAHLGQWVLRTDPYDDEPRTYYIPNHYKWVQYLHGLQDVGVKFAPIVGDNVCLACE